MDDMMNDALDARIQQAVSQSRGNTLQGMVKDHSIADLSSDDEYAEGLKLLAGEEEEEKKQGGGGLGAIAGMAGSFMGG